MDFSFTAEEKPSQLRGGFKHALGFAAAQRSSRVTSVSENLALSRIRAGHTEKRTRRANDAGSSLSTSLCVCFFFLFVLITVTKWLQKTA